MKKLLLMMVAIMTVTMASAQDEQMRGQRPRGQRMDRTEMMTKEYNLTKEQQEKVKALNEEYSSLFRMPGRGGRGQGMRNGKGPRGNQPNAEGKKTDGQTGATAQNGQRPSREDMQKWMQEREAKQKEYDGKLKNILSKDQFSAYEKRQEEMKKMRANRQNRQFRGQRNNN